MTGSPHIHWLDRAHFENFPQLTGRRWEIAFVVDVNEPWLAPHLAIPPTPQDIADLRKPAAGPRDFFLKRRALTRVLVAALIGVEPTGVVIEYDANGAPRVMAPLPAPFTSVSARGSTAAVAAAWSPIGIDIEPIGIPVEPVWDVLHPNERAPVEARWRAGSDDLFRDIWIAKEAWLKALGSGLKRDPAEIEASFDATDAFSIRDTQRNRRPAPGAVRTINIGKLAFRCAVARMPAD